MRKLAFLCSALLLTASTGPVRAEGPEAISENGFISGTMEIDFGTRRNLDTAGKFIDGSPAEGSKDTYKVNLNVAKTTEYAGTIVREPRLVSRVLGRNMQDARIIYDIGLSVRNPKDLTQKKTVGKWVGPIAIDDKGNYSFGGTGGESQLRMAIDAVGKAAAFTGPFTGRIIGKGSADKGSIESKVSEYARWVKGKKVVVTAKKVDPLQFVQLTLGEGPAQIYPRAVVNGNLDYDYETGNWYTNGIRFKYTLNGVEIEDVVTGSIKWTEDPSRASNGKGSYEFNLRFNEEKIKPASNEADAFTGSLDDSEAAFFEVDNSVPSMTGTVDYVDTLGAGDGDEAPVFGSKVTYNLNANKLTKQQAVNFFKLWMVIIGPTNDE